MSDISLPNGVPGSDRPSQATSPVGPPRSAGDRTGPTDAPTQTRETTPATRLGIFTIATAATAGGYYDDNVFATHADRRSDVAFFLRPEITAAAQGGDFGIQASGFVEGRKYTKYSSEDQINGGAAVSGVYQPDAATQVRGRAEYLHGHEDRGTGDTVFVVLDRPITFDQFNGAAALNNRFDHGWTSIGASALGVVYQNATLLGAPVDQTYRDVFIPALTGRVGYVVAPLTSVFAEVTGNAREFRYQPLSSTGYRAVLGLLLEPGSGARVKGEVFAGYMNQNYYGASLQTISTWTYAGSLSFLLMDTLTFTADGRREAKESALFGGVSLVESTVGGRFDFQVFDRFVVGAGATYLVDEFKGVGQADRYLSPLASAHYTVSKQVSLGLDYRMLDYRPDGFAFSGFRRNVVLASATVRF